MIRKYSFKGGIHPQIKKNQTESLSIQTFPAPQKVIIPLMQHMGTAAQPTIKRGDRVLVGQRIGESSGHVSASVHSSVSGIVLTVGPFSHPTGKQVIAVEIENDGLDDKYPLMPLESSWRDAAPGELIQKVQSAGVVGMGGSGFPTHVKLSPPSNKSIDTLIINGAECEPFITADYRLILERCEDLLTGILILKKILGAKNCYIGIEENKPEAIQVISKAISNQKYKEITLGNLKEKYPQGCEKQIISAFTQREVPSGCLPMDIGCIVHNVGTALAVFDAVVNGITSYERIVTVTGPTVKKPGNFLVRIGTPIRLLLEACETDFKNTKKVIMGGPMKGKTQSDLDAPVIKSTTGLLAIDFSQPAVRTYPCINCGHCVHACPIHLIPSKLAKFVEKEKIEDAVKWNLMNCIECGSCAFVCPSKINIVHFIRLGKFHEQVRRDSNVSEK